MAGEFVLSRRGRGDPRFQFGVDRIRLVRINGQEAGSEVTQLGGGFREREEG